MKPFAELHAKSFYSVLESSLSPRGVLDIAVEQKLVAVALADKAYGHGIIEFLEQAEDFKNVKPIIGAEVFLAENSRFENRLGIDGKESTIVLLAQNDIGVTNLTKVLSISALEGFYTQPRIDIEFLEKHKEGLLCLTSAQNGTVKSVFENFGEEKAKQKIRKLLDIFSAKNFFLEIISVEGALYEEYNKFLKKISEELHLQCIVSGNPHYKTPQDQASTQALFAVGKNLSLEDETVKNFANASWFKCWEEIEKILHYFPEDFLETARKNSLRIADSIDFKVEFHKNLLPHFEVPEKETPASFLRKQCEAAIPKKYQKENTQISAKISHEIQKRLDYELGIISKMGFDEYFLIVADLIHFAKNNKIAVGPGRGSAAGSIVSYLLEITTIDPLQYELLFERFLNPERISMPDIDIDFSDERRDEVLEYVIKKYGSDRVAKVCTFGTLSAKAALKDIGRTMNIAFSEMNALTKLLPNTPGFKLAQAEEIPDFRVKISTDKKLEKLYELAKKVEGAIRHVSVHACAVIIGKTNLSEIVPLQWAPGTEKIKITQIPYQQLEHLGLLKMDFLGLKNLSILEKTLENIEKTTQKKIDLLSIPIDDKKTFQMMSRGETTGVFQFESDGMRRYLRELKPSEFEDLVAMNALYRPGPMEYIPEYIKGKHKPTSVKYEHPILEEILKKTYGIAVYQEQIMRICQEFAGFSLGEADIVRKAMGKKIPKILAENREKFIQKSIEKGNAKKLAEKIFDDIIVPFSGYGFNRSHAVCYARIAYETAYLRANFPVEFMSAMMTTDRNNTDRIVLEMNECKKMGIQVLPPSINESGSYFSIVEQNSEKIIRFGLTAIKGLGEETVGIIISEREAGGHFINLQNFAERVPEKIINKKVLEALAFSGGFDAFGDRKAIVDSIADLSTYAKNFHEKKSQGQMGLFGTAENLAEISFQLQKSRATEKQKWEWERDSMGLFVSSHPLSGMEAYFQNFGTPIAALHKSHENKEEIPSVQQKKKITIHGIIMSVRKIRTKTKKNMAILNVEDLTGKMEVAVFPMVFEKTAADVFQQDAFVKIEGKVNVRDGILNFIADKLTIGSLEKIKKMHKNSAKKPSETAEETQQIEIPKGTLKEKLLELKELLNSAPDGQTNIQIVLGNKTKEFSRKIDFSFVEEKIALLFSQKKEIQTERVHQKIIPKETLSSAMNTESLDFSKEINGFVFD